MLKIEKIKKIKGDYEGMNFVLSAMSNDETRKNLNTVLWDGSCYWATDGHRIHYYYAKDTYAEIGVYNLVSKDKSTIVLEKTEEFKYPDITMLNIFRNNGPEWELSINTEGAGLPISYAKIIRKMADDEAIDFKFLEALPPDNYKVYSHGSRYCLCFANGNKGAGIMPLKVS
jgi:hypothetical protein